MAVDWMVTQVLYRDVKDGKYIICIKCNKSIGLYKPARLALTDNDETQDSKYYMHIDCYSDLEMERNQFKNELLHEMTVRLTMWDVQHKMNPFLKE